MNAKSTPSHRGLRPGVTLIELSVVVLVLLLFIAMTFVGVTAWKRGSDRAGCVMNIRHVQMAVRGYARVQSLQPGDDTGALVPPVNLTSQLIGPGKYVPSQPLCPGNGFYGLGGNTVPAVGSLYMTCSLEASDGHAPSDHGTW